VISSSQRPLPDNTQHTQDKHPCLRWDSNPRLHQASGRTLKIIITSQKLMRFRYKQQTFSAVRLTIAVYAEKHTHPHIEGADRVQTSLEFKHVQHTATSMLKQESHMSVKVNKHTHRCVTLPTIRELVYFFHASIAGTRNGARIKFLWSYS
jgi:hypothetical protein